MNEWISRQLVIIKTYKLLILMITDNYLAIETKRKTINRRIFYLTETRFMISSRSRTRRLSEMSCWRPFLARKRPGTRRDWNRRSSIISTWSRPQVDLELHCVAWTWVAMLAARCVSGIRRLFSSRATTWDIYPYRVGMNQFLWPLVRPSQCRRRASVSSKGAPMSLQASTQWTWNSYI